VIYFIHYYEVLELHVTLWVGYVDLKLHGPSSGVNWQVIAVCGAENSPCVPSRLVSTEAKAWDRDKARMQLLLCTVSGSSRSSSHEKNCRRKDELSDYSRALTGLRCYCGSVRRIDASRS
jgi:hypothetical protein